MAGPIRISIIANGGQAKREISTVQASLGRFGAIGKSAAVLGFGALAAGAVGFAKSAVQTEAQFSTSMRLIQAATKASGDEIGKLNDLAIQLGADTSFSANEAADAMLELAKAGLSTGTIMGGGVAGTLTLAAAGGTDLATAATIASNALNTFGLKGKDMALVAAALAGGANASSASVESLGQALQQVGPGATNAGLSLQETVAALSAFDAAGIKGSDAGTSLKTMLARLVPSTDKARDAMADLGLKFTTAKGEFLPLTDVAQQLQDKLGGLSDAQRVAALQTIFGSDATRAATVLFKEGSRGLQEFIDATNDQGAAQELAAARMSGTEGALERLSGAVETAKLRLGQELAPAVIAGADALGDNLVPAIETVVDGAKQIGTAVAPAFDAITNAIGNLLPTAEQAGGFFTDTFIPALSTTADAVAGVVNFIDGLPDPLKDIGVQAGIAALVLPRLAAGVNSVSTAMVAGTTRARQFGTDLAAVATRSQAAQGAVGRLGGVAKTAAGVGGLVALSQGASQADTGMDTLLSTLGGAATGFAIGGPVGAAVGAIGGFTTSLLGAQGAQDGLTASMQTFISTLDQQTGAFTSATRAAVSKQLEDQGLLKIAQDLQLPLGDMTQAILQGDEAIRQFYASSLDQVTTDQGRANLVGLKTSMQDLSEELFGGQAAWARQIEAMGRGGAAAQATRERVRSLGAQFDLLPSEVRTIVKEVGAEPTDRKIRTLARQYKTTPTAVRTLVAVLGSEQAVRRLNSIKTGADDVGKARPNLTPWLQALTGSLRRGEDSARRGGRNVQRDLEDGPGKARSDLSLFTAGIKSGTGQARAVGSSGGQAVGQALKAGVIAGFAGTQSILAAQAAAAVGAAIAAAKARAKIRSPSRVMDQEVGQQLGRGIEVGLAKRRKAVGNEGSKLIDSLLAGLAGGSSDKVGSAIDRVTGLIEKRVKAKDSDKERRREREILKHLSAEFAALRRNAREQDKIAETLSTAKDRYRELVDAANSYRDSVRDSFVSFGNVVGLGRDPETELVTIDGIVSELRDRASQAQRFRNVMAQLSLPGGLNSTTLHQLVDAGPEAALATAEAIAAGGKEAVAEINSLAGRIAGAGSNLGDQLRTKFHAAGIATAAALVSEVERQQNRLNRAGQQMARALVTQVEQRLAAITRGNRRSEAETPQPRTQPARPSARETFAATQRSAQTGGTAGDQALAQRLDRVVEAVDQLRSEVATHPGRTGVAFRTGIDNMADAALRNASW